MSLGSDIQRLISERQRINALTGRRPQIPPPIQFVDSVPVTEPKQSMGNRAQWTNVWLSPTPDVNLYPPGTPNGSGEDIALVSMEVKTDWLQSDTQSKTRTKTHYTQLGGPSPENKARIEVQIGTVPGSVIDTSIAKPITEIPSVDYGGNAAYQADVNMQNLGGLAPWDASNAALTMI